MNNEENETYQVIILNQLAKGKTTDNVINNLCKLFNKDKAIIEKMLCQQSYIVQTGVSKEIADSTCDKIKKTGIVCVIKKIPVVSANTNLSPGNTLIVCPKCKTQQKAAEYCSNCGVYYNKYNQDSADIASTVPKPSQSNLYQARQKQPVQDDRVWYKNKLLFVVVSIVFIGVIFKVSNGFEKKVIDPDIVGIKTYQLEDVRFIEDIIEPGYVNVIIFFANWCESCEKNKHNERVAMQRHPDLVIRRIDISRKDGFMVANNKYQLPIYHVPFTIIYDEDGDIIAEDKAKDRSDYYEGTNYFIRNFASR